MGFSQAREYLSRFYDRTRRNAKHKKSKSSSSTGRDAPCPNTAKTTEAKGCVGLSEASPLNKRSRLVLSSRIPIDKDTSPSAVGHSPEINLDPEHEIPGASALLEPHSPQPIKHLPLAAELGSGHVNNEVSDPSLEKDVITGNATPRNISDRTILSEKSNTTVNHDPSKHCGNPFETLNEVLHRDYINPFSDNNAVYGGLENSRCLLVPRGSSQDYGNHPEGINNCSFRVSHAATHHCATRSSESAGFEMISRRTSQSSDDTSHRILAGNDGERREFIRSRALLGFNASAEYFALDTLVPLSTSFINLGNASVDRPTSFLNRLRRVKSTLNLKRMENTKQSLRRIKTFTNVNVQFPLGSLKGRTVEELARLGGESILNLPREYSPGPLRLPTCIAAPAHYLMQHGTSAPYAHSFSHNETVVSALYSHYASQILRVEKIKGTINRTTRSIDLPSDHIYVEERAKGEAFVQDISTVFRHILCELPGGILGSSYLYRILIQIYDHNFASANGIGDPGRKEYKYDMTVSLAAKVRMITFALLALTTDMQLELICGVFGLLSLTADECAGRRAAHNYLHDEEKGPCEFCLVLSSSRSLGRTFGGLLYDPKGVCDPQLMGELMMTEGPNVADVTTMLIDLWKGISSHLRVWEVIETRR